MQTLGAFIKPCTIHYDKRISFVCCKENCDSRLVCSTCAKNHDSSHQNHFIAVADILTIDLDAQQLELRKIEEDSWKSDLENLRKIESYLESLQEIFARAVEDVRSTLLASSPLNWELDFKSLVKLKKRVLECDTENEMEVISVRKKYAETFSNFHLKKNQLRNGKRGTIPNINPKKLGIQTFKDIIMQGMNIQSSNSLKRSCSPIKRAQSPYKQLQSSSVWAWDSSKMSKGIKVNSSSKVIQYVGKKDDSSHIIFGKVQMTQGYHEWYLEMDCSHDDSGIAFGIMESDKVKKVNFNDFDGEKGIWRASNGAFCFEMTSLSTTKHVGLKTKCILDFDRGVFEIFADKKMVATAEIDRRTVYIPFAGFFNEGSVTLSFN